MENLIRFHDLYKLSVTERNSLLKRTESDLGRYTEPVERILKAIKEDGLNWDHVSELMRWDTPVADLYHLEKIPSNVLVDPSGKIIGTDLFGERLLEKLELIFTK